MSAAAPVCDFANASATCATVAGAWSLTQRNTSHCPSPKFGFLRLIIVLLADYLNSLVARSMRKTTWIVKRKTRFCRGLNRSDKGRGAFPFVGEADRLRLARWNEWQTDLRESTSPERDQTKGASPKKKTRRAF